MSAVAAADTERPRRRSRSSQNNGELTQKQIAAALAEFPFRFAMIPISQMFVDTSYQRPPTPLVDEIKDSFIPALVQTLALSLRRNGSYAVMDGQTRMIACEALGLEALPSLVYEGLEKSDEAKIFELIQTARRNVSSYYRFRASVQGKNPRSVAIVNLVKSLDLTNTAGDIKYQIGNGPNDIRSVASLEYGYELSPFALERALTTWNAVWPNQPPDGRFIRALSLYFHRHEDADDEHVVRRLGTKNQSELRTNALHLEASGTVKPPGGKSKYGFLAMVIERVAR